jgi:hypothetical protein
MRYQSRCQRPDLSSDRASSLPGERRLDPYRSASRSPAGPPGPHRPAARRSRLGTRRAGRAASGRGPRRARPIASAPTVGRAWLYRSRVSHLLMAEHLGHDLGVGAGHQWRVAKVWRRSIGTTTTGSRSRSRSATAPVYIDLEDPSTARRSSPATIHSSTPSPRRPDRRALPVPPQEGPGRSAAVNIAGGPARKLVLTEG